MFDRLRTLDEPVRLSIIGMGAMGKGLFYQAEITAGFRCLAIADIDLQKAIEVASWLRREYRIVGSVSEADQVIRSGILAVCEDGNILAGCEGIDVMIEASSSVFEAGQFCELALKSGKHVSMMNAEADLAFGPYFLELARENGVVYSSCDGDQHGVIKQLVDEMVLWGFEPVMAGNIKGFLDRYSDPVKIIPEADKRKLDYKMAAAYTDGTKLNIEMSLVANALNMKTVVPGMLGPVAGEVREVLHLFDFERLWDGTTPCVDYILGAEPGGGVFTIGYSNNDYQRFMMNYYKMGEGPFYLFYRPYHLCHVESLKWIARAVFYGESLLQPVHGFKTNVIAYAKKDLKKGQLLDGIGGFCCYGLIENSNGPGNNGLPICLAEGARLLEDIPKDHRINFSDVEQDKGNEGLRLFEAAQRRSFQKYDEIDLINPTPLPLP